MCVLLSQLKCLSVLFGMNTCMETFAPLIWCVKIIKLYTLNCIVYHNCAQSYTHPKVNQATFASL